MPEEKLVGVRVVRNSKWYTWETDGFAIFLQLAAGLTGEKVAAPPVQ